jgi:hypothetical protein
MENVITKYLIYFISLATICMILRFAKNGNHNQIGLSIKNFPGKKKTIDNMLSV